VFLSNLQGAEIPLSGKFDCWNQGFDFPDLLVGVCAAGRTGELSFRSPEAEKTIVIQNGRVIFARSSSTDDRLGPYLLRTGKVRFDHLMELTRFVSPTKRFGAVLVENHVLSPKDLVQGVIGQVRSIVLSLFHWTEAEYSFEEKALEKETITLRIATPKLVVDGVKQVTSWRRVTSGIGSLDAVYQTTNEADAASSSSDFDAATLELLSDLRGPKTIAEACGGSELSAFVVCQLLWAFRALQWISPVTEMPVVEASVEEDEEADDLSIDDADSDGIGAALKEKL
jgi:two-component system OmpR family response regulator